MNTYTFTVKVECDTPEQAQQVMIERTYIDPVDGDLGFEYKIDFEPWQYEKPICTDLTGHRAGSDHDPQDCPVTVWPGY